MHSGKYREVAGVELVGRVFKCHHEGGVNADHATVPGSISSRRSSSGERSASVRPMGAGSPSKTHAGAEVDLLWEENGRFRAAKMKLSDAPRMSRSMHNVLQDLHLDHLFVIYPGERTYPMADQVTAVSIRDLDVCRGTV